jgi:hypothetical protein
MKKACSTQETPRSDLISKAKQFLINKSTATVYNVDSDSISTPDSALGKDTEHIYTFDKNMMKDVARNVMVNVDSPKGKDLVKALDCIKPFPSTLKKRKSNCIVIFAQSRLVYPQFVKKFTKSCIPRTTS